MTTPTTLPHWDMTVVYPSLDAPEFATGFAAVQAQVVELRDLFATEQIEQRAGLVLDDATIATFERVMTRINSVLAAFHTLSAYLNAFVTTDSRDVTAQARLSELQQSEATLSQLMTRYTAWLGALDVEALIARSPLAADHSHALRTAKVSAAHLMSPAEEALAAELNLSSGAAWEKLYESLTSQITVPITTDGTAQDLPMSMVRNLAYAPDRAVRQRAFQAEVAAWQRNAEPLAAALNSIKGQVNTLAQRRSWESPLDEALFAASIDHATLDAMFAAAREALPDFRRYLHIKAGALGLEKLAFYDIFAPLSASESAWSFAESQRFIIEQFGTFSPRMRDFATRVFAERWIDAEPRVGKRGGGFCMWLRGDESRILVNFEAGYDGMSTMAHELGHGYHNLNLAPRTTLQRELPMTLAETASIFCETLVKAAALRSADRAAQIAIIEASLQGACQVVVDIMSRYLFESRVFAQRRQRELSVDELCQIMLDAQRETYGDGLDETQLHPYMWAAKPHYYSAGRSFYNFPYMFGLLFGLGLFARYQQHPEEFQRGYDSLLASTGLADAATLAARFDIDLRARDFWQGSFAVLHGDIDRFAALVAD